MNLLNQLMPAKSSLAQKLQQGVGAFQSSQRKLLWLVAGLTGVVGIALVSTMLMSQVFSGCSGVNSKELNLPIAVMPGSCQMTLKPQQDRNFSTMSGLFQMAGLSNAEYYIFTTTEPKEKITEFYQQQLKSKGFRSDPVQPGNATGLKINLSGVSMLYVVTYTEQQAAQMIEGDFKGKNTYMVAWNDGQFSILGGK